MTPAIRQAVIFGRVSTSALHVHTLPELIAGIAANPTGRFFFVNDYDASVDGTYANAPITTQFKGTVDFLGHRISNLSIVDSGTAVDNHNIGLFAFIDTAGVVKNLRLHVTQVTGHGSNTGALCGWNQGLIQFCSGEVNTTADKQGSRNGGLIGYNHTTGTIEYCSASGYAETTAGLPYLGGFCGYTWGLIRYCSSSVHTYGVNTSLGTWGGCFVGAVGNTSGTINTAIVHHCSATGLMENPPLVASENFSGGFVGNIVDGQVYDCFATGAVTGGSFCGGFVGRIQGSTGLVSRCWSTGKVSGISNKIGGFCGQLEAAVSHCWSSGSATGTGSCGGFAGQTLSTAVVDHCFAFGSVSAGSGNYAAGFIGANQGVVTQCYAMGIASAGTNAGGFVGQDVTDANITLCYWNKTTSGRTNGAGNVVTPAGIAGLTTTQFLAALPSGFDAAWTQAALVMGGHPYLVDILAADAPVIVPAPTPTQVQIVLLAADTGTWIVPADFTATNTIEAIGAGGNGADATASNAGRGGGGGAYAKIKNLSLTPGASISVQIGAGGSLTKTQFRDSSTLVADCGGNGTASVSGVGGLVANCVANGVGAAKFAGAAGGVNTNNGAGGGGGGAAGPNGAGKAAGSAAGNSSNAGGGGGGAANNGAAGSIGSTSKGGDGGASFDGTAGGVGSSSTGAAGGAGSNGSGGGGGYASITQASVGGAGSNDARWGTVGPGSGGGGGGGMSVTLAVAAAGGAGGAAGGGGGGGGRGTTTPGTGGIGGQGTIVITYTPAS